MNTKIVAIVAFVFGLLVSAGSFFEIYHLPAPIDRHLLYVFVGGVFFGALLMMPTLVIGLLKQVLTVIGPYIPMVGGRRATDPPAPEIAPKVLTPVVTDTPAPPQAKSSEDGP